MNETIKSSIIAGLAIVVTFVAFVTMPKSLRAPSKNVGDKISPNFTDTTQMDFLEFVQFDPSNSKVRRLKIALRNGNWVIASHDNYPAGAEKVENAIYEIATNLIKMKVFDTAARKVAHHEEFGTLDPGEDNNAKNPKMRGLRIGIYRRDGATLADLIVGDPVQNFPQQRFVRKPGNTAVYIAKFDFEKIPYQWDDMKQWSKFEQWIDNDALRIKDNNIIKMGLRNYTTTQGKTTRRFDIGVDWNSRENQPTLAFFSTYVQGKKKPGQLKSNEQLHSKIFEELHDTLQRLNIIDVESKPKPLDRPSANDEEANQVIGLFASLIEHEFYPDKDVETIAKEGFGSVNAAEGETHVITEDGIRYILRFGKVSKSEGNATLPRYMLVTAELHEPTLQAIRDKALKGDDTPEKDSPAKDGQREKKKDFQQIRSEAIEKVENLNQRFDQLYYIISENTYHKLHLSMTDIILSNQNEEESISIDAFRKLVSEGLQKPPPKKK